jgi:hypothetical protein
MRVPPSGPNPLHHTESTAPSSGATVSKKQFDQKINAPKPPANAAPVGAADIIGEVKSLATDVKSGAISKEEASRRFVSIVIEKRHDLSVLGPKGKQIEDAVKEIAGDDPHFVSRLDAQLQKLSKA